MSLQTTDTVSSQLNSADDVVRGVIEPVISESGSALPMRLVFSDHQNGFVDDYIAVVRSADTVAGSGRVRVRVPTEPELLNTTGVPEHEADQVLIFLQGSVNPKSLQIISLVSRLGRRSKLRCVVLISTLQHHLAKTPETDLEQLLSHRLKPHLSHLTIIRTGFVLGAKSNVRMWARRLSAVEPLISSRLSTTFLSVERLSGIVEQEFQLQSSMESQAPLSNSQGVRTITVLGQRQLWKDIVKESSTTFHHPLLHGSKLVCGVLGSLGGRWLVEKLARLTGRLSKSWKQITFEMLKPRTVCELKELCNRHSCEEIQIAGYNNGVNHFGWKFPTKTVVQTIDVKGKAELVELPLTASKKTDSQFADEVDLGSSATGRFKVGAGLTLKSCIVELSRTGHEFFVVPNYSYISMGTLFFVPVHGSGSQVSTLGDTIEEVELWDSLTEQSVILRRGDTLFRDSIYNTTRHLLVVSLTLLVRNSTSYSVRRETLDNATTDDVLLLLNDPEASNVEIRKNRAAATAIEVSRYYSEAGTNTPGSPASVSSLVVPRDRMGRVWDRLEETPLVSTLFHWFVRTYAFHVELFLKPDEFRIFWEHHQSLPVSKIQLRRVLKDGMTHSACQHEDCVSADLFMTQGNRDVFCQFIARYLPNVRTNPGKQTF